MTGRKNPRQKRRGAIALLAAILLVSLLGAVALAIDLGIVVMARSELQAAADAAAIAGATLIAPEADGSLQSASRHAAEDYAEAHSVELCTTPPALLNLASPCAWPMAMAATYSTSMLI